LNSSSEEEIKEAPPFHSSKYDNSRSVTQAKNKKTAQVIKRSEEAVVDMGELKPSEFVPLQKDILKMLDEKDYSDITLVADGREIYAHRAVLSSRSTYFEGMFSHEFKETDKNKISLKGVASYELFHNLLEFMYSDCMKVNIKNVFDMLSLADEYGVGAFKDK
jgi:hypothetical protein